MRYKFEINYLFIERIAMAVFLISLIVFLVSPSLGSTTVISLGINIIILLMAMGLTLFLVNRRLKLQYVIPQKSVNVTDALQLLDPVQNQILKWVFRILPWILLVIVPTGTTNGSKYYPFIISFSLNMSQNHYLGIAVAALSLLAFQGLLKRIPETFRALWHRKIILSRATVEDKDTATSTSSDENTQELYKDFVEKLTHTLNDPRQVFVGLICGFLGSNWLFEAVIFSLSLTVSDDNPFFLLMLFRNTLKWLITFGIGYVIGLQIWRMIIVGVMVRKLSITFDLALQRGHPDDCEGLSPLGNICLWNALILSPAGIYLSMRLILGDFYQELLYFLLIVIIAIASISFFAPLWNVHRIMLAKKDEIKRQLDQLSQSINRLSRHLLDNGSELEPTESEKVGKKLDGLHKIYKDNQRIPVWPFNTRILAKFVTSQIVPILSLVGLGQPIVEIISSMMSFLTGLSGPSVPIIVRHAHPII